MIMLGKMISCIKLWSTILINKESFCRIKVSLLIDINLIRLILANWFNINDFLLLIAAFWNNKKENLITKTFNLLLLNISNKIFDYEINNEEFSYIFTEIFAYT